MNRALSFLVAAFLLAVQLLVAGNVNAAILVVAPHPDDDLLYAAGVAYHARLADESVTIVFVTNGDSTGISSGFHRQGEAVTAQSLLGLPEDSLIFLGYPDGHLLDLYRDFPEPTDVFTAPTGQSQTYGNRGLGRADYHSYRWGSPAEYNWHNVVADLADILATYSPSHIITTAEFDDHPDHAIVYELVAQAIVNVNNASPDYDPVIYKTIVHWPHGNWPGAFDPEANFPELQNLDHFTNLHWDDRVSLHLPSRAVSRKLDAIVEHRSQGSHYGLLGRFVRKDELFWAERLFGADPPVIADAGQDLTVTQGADVYLDGSGSRGGNGAPLRFQWSQVSGTPVTLWNAQSPSSSFNAPDALTSDVTLVFRLDVDDGESRALADFVSVRVIASNPSPNIAPLAQLSASSENSANGQGAEKAVDGVVDGWPGDGTREWVTLGEGAGAWLDLTWSEIFSVDRVILYDRPNIDDQILAGTIIFSDGSMIEVGSLSNTGRGDEYAFPARYVSNMRLIVEEVSNRTVNIGLAEVEVFGVPADTNLVGLNVSVEPAVGGSVTKMPSQAFYVLGSEVALEAHAAVGYEFSHWSGDVSGAENPLTATVSGPMSVVAHFSGHGQENIASLANVSASSENVGTGQLAIKAVDGVADGWPGDYTREWATLGEGVGAWLQLDWDELHLVDRVVLYDRPNANDHIRAARLLFSDGSMVDVPVLDNAGGGDEVVFSPREINSLRLTIQEVSDSTQNIGLAEIEVHVTQSESHPHTLSLAIDPPGSGTVSRDPDQPSYSPGTDVAVHALAAAGYEFSHWSGDSSGAENPLTVTMTGSRSVTAHFAALVETVSTPSVPAGPANGTLGETYSYSSEGAVSSLGNPVEYQFDWGDGRQSEWLSVPSAVSSWPAAGTYGARARARSAPDPTVVSEWSAALSVVIEVAVVVHTVDTVPAGLEIVVDGSTFTAPQPFNWEPGSSHSLSVSSPQVGVAGTRYVFAGWSDGGAQSHTVMAQVEPTTYTVLFSAEYRLDVLVTPGAGGVVDPAGESWHEAGALVVVSATPAAGYVFSHWSGDASGTENPLTVTMAGSRSVTAHFVPIPGALSVSPEDGYDVSGRAGGPFSPNRQNYTITNTGGAAITWRAMATASWINISPTTGTLQPGTSTTVALAIVNRETRHFGNGLYTDAVLFENLTNGEGNTARQVNLTIENRR